ncbi:flavodoxin family protein [Verrucomicrobiota bacterium]
MRVLAINSSPKMNEGNTAFMLTPFLEGMKEAGANVELLYTSKLKVNPCRGEYNCFFKTPGSCCQKDDMKMVCSKLREADIWVFATPVYIGGITGPMKNLLDRIIPLVDPSPFVLLRDGRCGHDLRAGNKVDKVVLVSNCGFWGTDNFDPLIAYMRDFCQRGINREFAGALLRPTGRVFRAMMDNGAPADDILEAAREAGRQLVQTGKMSPETLDIISREVVPLDAYVQKTNEMFQQALEED